MHGIHPRYQAGLDIKVEKWCLLTQAMRRSSILGNTLRDYIGISELHIIDTERYKRVVKAEQQRLGKVSAKSIELHCTVVVKEYRVHCNIYWKKKSSFLFTQRMAFTPKSKFEEVLGVTFESKLFTECAPLTGSKLTKSSDYFTFKLLDL